MEKPKKVDKSQLILPIKIKSIIIISLLLGSFGMAFGIFAIVKQDTPNNTNTNYPTNNNYYYYNISYPTNAIYINNITNYITNWNITTQNEHTYIIPPHITVEIRDGFFIFENNSYDYGQSLWSIIVYGTLIMRNATIICSTFLCKGNGYVILLLQSNIIPLTVTTRRTSEGMEIYDRHCGIEFEDNSMLSFDGTYTIMTDYIYNNILTFDMMAMRRAIRLNANPTLLVIFCGNSGFI